MSAALDREIALLEVKGKIESQAQQEMSDAQRQYYLRQQLKAIQEELGEGEADEIKLLREKVTAAGLPETVQQAADRELGRLARMNQASPDYQMTRTYLEWLLEIPWSVTTEDRLDPIEARRVLDEDHYDLDKIKERIVEYLAVRKLKGDMKGPILCFVGPPGVGKTSLGQSIARAMNRKFVRISLGGVRDEAEIRGHRRTYIGALPGRIVNAMKQAGAMNPVFMLDEMDKLAAGFQGDPAAALLEVLDPAQNHSFRDHYLEVPLDLSRVLFIATANQLGTLHPALLDRMEVVSLSGYTEDEKRHIARRFLIPRQLQEHGLPDGVARDHRRRARRGDHAVHAGSGRPQPRENDRRHRPQSRRAAGRPAGRGDRPARDHACRRRAGAAVPRPGALPARVAVPHVAPGCRHRRGVDRDRWRRALHRSHVDAGRQPADHPDRSTRQRHAGVGARGGEPHPLEHHRTGDRAGLLRPQGPARPRPGGRDSQGRAFGGRDHGHGDPVGDTQDPDPVRCGHDRRDHVVGAGAARRRHSREGAGRTAHGHQDLRACPPETPPTSRSCPRI